MLSDIVAETTNSDMNELEKALALHNWVCDHMTYDPLGIPHTLSDALLSRVGICSTYTNLYHELLNCAGFENGECGNRDHSFNAVKIGNECVVTDIHGDTLASASAQITQPTVPFAITRDPESVTAEIGETVVLSIEATGEGLTYQWQNSRDDETWSNSGLTGSNTPAITIEMLEFRFGYYWR